MNRRVWPVVVAALASFTPTLAAFHLMQVVEVFPGTETQPNAQYVVIQMYASGQQFVNGHSIKVYNSTGTEVGSSTFAGNVPIGANQTKILIATTQASALFSVTADLTMLPTIPLSGGAVCFDGIDCVSWGNFSGSLPSPAGTPVRLCQTVGLYRGYALFRRLFVSGGTTTLEASDDTNNSSNDFDYAQPTPRNNAGVSGTVPSTSCGDGAIEGLEECDDNNSDPGDGCSAGCQFEACGNCNVDPGEDCDPPVGSCTATCEAGPPPEVSPAGSGTPLRFTSHTTRVWQDAASLGANFFNVSRGTVSGLALADYGSCFASPVATNTTTDATDPAVGAPRIYLVTGTNSLGEGPAGNDSDGAPRTFASPCP